MKDNGAMSYTESAEVPKEGSEPIKLTEQERIDKEAESSAKRVYIHKTSARHGYYLGYIAGATSKKEHEVIGGLLLDKRKLEIENEQLQQQLKEERNKAIDECRHEIALWLTEPEKLGSELMERITALKSDSK